MKKERNRDREKASIYIRLFVNDKMTTSKQTKKLTLHRKYEEDDEEEEEVAMVVILVKKYYEHSCTHTLTNCVSQALLSMHTI